MKSSLKFLLIFVVAVILSGCASEAKFYPLNASPEIGAPIPTEQVELFITQKPSYPYRELGLITYTTNGSYPQNEINIFNIMRQKAASIGADGLIILNAQSSVQSYPSFSTDLYGNLIETSNVYSDTVYRGMAIDKL